MKVTVELSADDLRAVDDWRRTRGISRPEAVLALLRIALRRGVARAMRACDPSLI
jgi:hypothetical protein